MGIFDAFQHVITRTAQRDAPRYTPPASAPRDSLHAGTNSDASIQNIRSYLAEGAPARTGPPTAGDGQPQRPSTVIQSRMAAVTDTRKANRFPTPGVAGSALPGTGGGTLMAYGVQPSTPDLERAPAIPTVWSPKDVAR